MKNFFIILLFPYYLFSQEVISNLNYNQILFNKNNVQISNKNNILNLPFIDDFSYNSSYVDDNLWLESSVFVNRTYPINPPTIGVATFDGLDSYGFPRNISQVNNSLPSDTLQSKPIDISISSSVYLMFYFQSKGIGDTPEISDTICLELLNDTLGWEMIWHSVSDTSMTNFKKIVLIIDDSRFLHDKFQFRFRNYATVSGNFDHWHLDYVKLDNFNSITDTLYLDDVSFVYNSPSILKRYSRMPLNHFVGYENDEIKDSIDVLLRNNNASINVDYQYNVIEDNILLETFPNTGSGWRNYSIYSFDTIGNFSHDPSVTLNPNTYSTSLTDSTLFTIQHIIQTSSSDNRNNDTLYHLQDFYNYFSYDDGTPESAYGITFNGAKLAYEFKLNRPDTLRAIQMFFPQMSDTVNHIPFKLTVWSEIFGSETILYQKEVFPVHTSNDKFYTYYIDSLFQIVGTFYIGWIQNSADLLNIGLDKNFTANDYMYYNIGSGWLNSSYLGSWMIRPVVSEKKLLSNLEEFSFIPSIYPNPAHESLFIKSNNSNSLITIYNTQGRLINHFKINNFLEEISVANLSPGMYIIAISNGKYQSYHKVFKK
mgnify:CR=1 FL=1